MVSVIFRKLFIRIFPCLKVTYMEYLRGVHQSHNSSRDGNNMVKKLELKSILAKWDKFTFKEYLDVLINFYRL